MDRFYTIQLGTYQDRSYFLTVAGEPSINDIQAFVVTIHYNDPLARESVEIARIDTSHGHVHFDRGAVVRPVARPPTGPGPADR